MLTRLEITSRKPVLGGQAFGKTGPYETLTGSAYFAVDPTAEPNRPIADIGLAPVNAAGLVECRADLYILKPVDSTRGNGALLYHVVNRGRKGFLDKFNLAENANRPETPAHFGDGFLQEAGYAVAACGWQADVPPEAPDNPHLMTLDVPVAVRNGCPIRGPVGCEIVVDQPVTVHSLGSRYHRPGEPADPEDPGAVLTVRAYPDDPPEVVPRCRWAFARLENGRRVPSTTTVYLSTGFRPGAVYRLVYTAQNPPVLGLGFAATRDLVSFLKYETADSGGRPNPLARALDRALAFGSSQSGRFLRHLLYLDFNRDEKGRKVFDGVFAHVAGGARGSFNHRFAQPSRHASAHTDHDYPTEQFPFADLPQADPETGRTEGLLDRCEQSGVTPKIFYTNTSTEYWNRGASLVHTDPQGRTDLPLHPVVRFYHFSGTQHGPAPFPPTVRNALPDNPVDFRPALRALLLVLDAWVRDGTQPPPSCYGTLAGGLLAEPAAEAVGFPAIPGLPFPRQARRPRRMDHGPEWANGIVSREPPAPGKPYGVRVPRTDADGNECAGIRMPEVAVPLGTFTGWRFRAPRTGASKALVGLQGTWAPFARTEAERQASADPRPSVEARYTDRSAYLEQIEAAAHALVEARFMLPRDIGRTLERAATMYDWTVGHRTG